jgi:hypothetical protein
MSAPEHHNDPLLARIERLEQQNRRLKHAGLACLLVLASVGLMGQTTTTHKRTTHTATPPPAPVLPKDIVAESYTLKDSAGKVRAELAMGATGPSFKLRDQNGSALVNISLNDSAPNGATLLMSDPQHAAGLSISVLEGAGSQMMLTGPSADIQAHLGASADGSSLDLTDQSGFSAVIGDGMLTTKSGQVKKTTAGSIALFNKDRKVLWSAP